MPFYTEDGELCKVENLDNVEIPERYFSELDLGEGTTVTVENEATGLRLELPVAVRPDVQVCVIGLDQKSREALGLPGDIGDLHDEARKGHNLRIIVQSS